MFGCRCFLVLLQDESWDEGYRAFSNYKEDEYGMRIIPKTFVTNGGFKLGRWQDNQRQAFRRGTLSPTRKKRLDAAGMLWDTRMRHNATVGRASKRGALLPPRETLELMGINPDLYDLPSAAADAQNADGSADGSAERTSDGDGSTESARICEERRRLSADGSALALSLTEQPPPLDERAWHDEWRQRLGCWWIALPNPTQSQLRSCLGALGVHLGARLEGLMERIGRAPSPQSAPPIPELGCEWLQSEDGFSSLPQLPDFPEFGHLDLALPPIPRLVPVHLGELHSRGAPTPELAPSASPVGSLALGLGAGALAFTFVAALSIGWRRNRNK